MLRQIQRQGRSMSREPHDQEGALVVLIPRTIFSRLVAARPLTLSMAHKVAPVIVPVRTQESGQNHEASLLPIIEALVKWLGCISELLERSS